MPLFAAAICCWSRSAACVSPVPTSTFDSSRPDLSSGSNPLLMTFTAMPLATSPALYPPMPSASTARPASPSTKTESSLCERTIPGCERMAQSSAVRSFIGGDSGGSGGRWMAIRSASVTGTLVWRECRAARRARRSLNSAADSRAGSIRARLLLPAREPDPGGHDDGDARDGSEPVQRRRVALDPRLDHDVLGRDLAGEVPEQPA